MAALPAPQDTVSAVQTARSPTSAEPGPRSPAWRPPLRAPLRVMKRTLFVGAFVAAVSTLALVAPAWAHGDHDARPLARSLQAGPYSISLWQVYPEAGMAIQPHLIVMFDGAPGAPAAADVSVEVNAKPMDVVPSMTTSHGWETIEGLDVGDVVTVTIFDGGQTWHLEPVIVPPVPTSMLPMRELIYISIALTAGAALWVAGMTARAWRRPVVY